MSLPEPEPGLVISYAYLWRHEHNKGQDEGRKDRPALIVLSIDNAKTGNPRVTVAAITHTMPHSDTIALEVSPAVKRHLGLDDERSWIVLDEVNQFNWPGFDVRPLPGSRDRYTYGFVPPKLYTLAKTMLLQADAKRKVKVIPRD